MSAHDAQCPDCGALCSWQRSESDWKDGAPFRCTYFYKCECGKKFTKVETEGL